MFVLFVGLRSSVVLQARSPVTSGRLVAPPSVPTAWTRLLGFVSHNQFRVLLVFCSPFPDIPLLLVSPCGNSFVFFSVFGFSCALILRASLPRPRAVVMNACHCGTTPLDGQARPHMREAPRGEERRSGPNGRLERVRRGAVTGLSWWPQWILWFGAVSPMRLFSTSVVSSTSQVHIFRSGVLLEPFMIAVNAVRRAVFDVWEDRCHYRGEGVHEVFPDDH